MSEALSRRAWLFGRPTVEAKPGRVLAAVSSACLTLRGVACQSCRDACPQSAIRFRPSRAIAQPEIDSERCTGCGDCIAPCPTDALVITATEHRA